MEANIVISGTALTSAQSMTVRVAIEAFSQSIASEVDLPDPNIFAAYEDRIEEIRTLLYGESSTQNHPGEGPGTSAL